MLNKINPTETLLNAIVQLTVVSGHKHTYLSMVAFTSYKSIEKKPV